MKGLKHQGENLDGFTAPRETSTRKKIDQWLINLGWVTDEESPNCNVTTERALTKEQKAKLRGKEPDYILYKSGTTEIVATIEAKAKGEDLDAAMKDAIGKYATPLRIPIVFVTDGSFFRTWYQQDGKPLMIDSELVNQLLGEKTLLRFLSEGSSIISESPHQQYTREQLIDIFKWVNDQLRKEGLRQGVERFTEFANFLFLKLISEIEDDNEKHRIPRMLAKEYCWESFASKDEQEMTIYINGIVLPKLVKEYNHIGSEVFEHELGIKSPKTVKSIVDKLSGLTLLDADSDIKGDAFEYFLKDSITVGNELGEYFTPRHIVRLMVDLIDPQFGEKTYDPTCGTAGFLIEAFRHVKRNLKVTPETLKILKEKTVWGRELTNTARIAKMNMILTGDGHANILRMDSLHYPVDGEYDCVLANPPYGQDTDWGNLYDVPSKQADCVFIQHIMRSLNPTGRAAVIVPEGFLFRLGNDERVRELLLKSFRLDAIISLPAGVFQPYTGSKTNIIIFRAGVGSTRKVWFYEVTNDGYDLGATRRPVPGSDLPDLRLKWQDKPVSLRSWESSVETIENNDWMLLASVYKPKAIRPTSYINPVRALDQILEHQKELVEQLTVLKKELEVDLRRPS